MIKLKKFICFSAGLVLLAGGLLFVFQLSNRQVLSEPEAKQTAEDIAVVAGESNQPATDIDQAETAAKSVKLIIKGKKEPLQYEVEIGDKSDAFNILKKAGEINNFSVKYSDSAFGVFVEQIGDTANSDTEFWLYYLNDQAGKVASDRQAVKSGDKVEWRYE